MGTRVAGGLPHSHDRHHRGQHEERGTSAQTYRSRARPGPWTRNVHLSPCGCPGLVSFGHGRRPHDFAHPPQRNRMDEDSRLFHLLGHAIVSDHLAGGPAILGYRNLRQLYVFNRGQALFTTTRPLEPLFRCGVRMRFSSTPHVADPDLGTLGGSSPPAFSCTSSSVGMGVR
ncbi:hypothetical protein ASPFODRAFT_517457 [Aspergillus luchuensis CBS 106.47]|uniref:Uncharacterized protein n=1 Tax=Aspergillus luchuensis (strain CBS 106.47) TaxID=1137211 RepID=A0A1M3SZL0_ASPLC|nr:hypothetical protein ASPFODRAFT_517457 [Aspergillus luchuensis CBS 106.47]